MSTLTDRARVLVTVEELARLIDSGAEFVLLDVRGVADAAESPQLGLAGAIAVDPAVSFAGAGGGLRGARPLPEIEDIQTEARAWGVRHDRPIVLYDDKGGLQAARGWWVLKWAGLADVRLLDGGLAAWIADGKRLDGLRAPPGDGDAVLTPGHLPVLTADDAAQFAAKARLIDARADSAFQGDPVAGKGGHIPGSISLPANGNLAADGRFESEAGLRARYGPVLARPDNEFGVSCGSGVSAAHNIVALATLGRIAALFPGSWSAWSADKTRPVAYGSGSILSSTADGGLLGD